MKLNGSLCWQEEGCKEVFFTRSELRIHEQSHQVIQPIRTFTSSLISYLCQSETVLSGGSANQGQHLKYCNQSVTSHRQCIKVNQNFNSIAKISQKHSYKSFRHS
jgi:hypothetical protein